MIGEYSYLEVESADLGRMLGEVGHMENENVAFKCGSPNQCSQCARCSKC